jgi:hypothetical protein
MPTLLVGTLDRLLVSVLLAGARRRWPLVRLVPRRWVRPLLMPAARRVRASLARAAMFVSLAVIAAGAVLFLSR